MNPFLSYLLSGFSAFVAQVAPTLEAEALQLAEQELSKALAHVTKAKNVAPGPGNPSVVNPDFTVPTHP